MRYPPAEWKGDGASGGTFTGAPYRVVIHTTETRHIPGYRDGQSAPHLTYSPTTRKWYQHTDLRYACRALRNESGGVETNRANALQLEIVAYSSRLTAERLTPAGLWVSDLTDRHLADIRRFLEFTYEEFGVEPVWPGKQAFSSAEANTPGFRMTPTEWNRFTGVCGHQHVPEQHRPDRPGHWDPGALNWSALMAHGNDEEEETMTVREFVEGLKPGNIDELFDAGIITGNRDDWKALLDKPDAPEWKRFYTELQVQTAIRSGRTGTYGVYKIALSGKATPI